MSVKCKNCGQPYSGQVCPNCKESDNRLSLGGMARDVSFEVLQLEGGFLETFLQMWKNPGQYILRFLQSKERKAYYPIKYFLFWTFLLGVLISTMGKIPNHIDVSYDFAALRKAGLLSSDTIQNFLDFFLKFMFGSLSLGFAVQIPFIAVVCKFLFPRPKYSIAELTMAHTFIFAQYCSVFCLILPFVFLMDRFIDSNEFIVLIPTLFGILYLLIRVYKSFFNNSWPICTLKSISIFYISGFLNFIILFMIYLLASYLHSY
jgi:hypothetical protein